MKENSSLAELVRRILEVQAGDSALRIGVSGHRVLEQGTYDLVASELNGLFAMLANDQPARERFTAVSSLAIGTDQLFVAAAQRHSISSEVVLPFSNFADDFAEGPELERFESLLSSAEVSITLPWQARSNGAYLAGGLWVVDHSDIFLAVWNGKGAGGFGGTGDVVDYCKDVGKPCIHLHSESLQVREL